MRAQFVILVCALLLVGCGSDRPVPSQQEQADAVTLLGQLQQAGGLTRYSCDAHEALVTPQTWATANADGKRSLAIAVAAACGGANVVLVDSQSGKRLAHVGATGYVID